MLLRADRLPTPSAHRHQWIFVTDTTDVLYPPDDWYPSALAERLASAISESRSSSELLLLLPLLQRIAIHAFEATYDTRIRAADLGDVEHTLLHDMFARAA